MRRGKVGKQFSRVKVASLGRRVEVVGWLWLVMVVVVGGS